MNIEDRVRSTLRARAEAVVVQEDGQKLTSRERPSKFPRRVAGLVAAAVVVVAALALAGPRNVETAESNEERLPAFLSSVRELGASDYDPAGTPGELAVEADLVIEGEITGVQSGQSYAVGPETKAQIATSVLEVEILQTLSGEGSSPVEGDSVFIEIAHPAFVSTTDGGTAVPYDQATFAATVPLGSKGLFFLDDRTEEPYLEWVIDPGAGRPEGSRLFATFPQGFLLEGANDTLVSVNESLSAMPVGWQDLDSLEDVMAAL